MLPNIYFVLIISFCECDSDGSDKRSRYDAINIWNSTSGEKGFMELYDTGRRRKSRKVRFPWTAFFFNISRVNLYFMCLQSASCIKKFDLLSII